MMGDEWTVDTFFYTDWLEIGDPARRVADTYPVVTPAEGEIPAGEQEPPPSKGFTCRYANPLRNGNTYAALPAIRPDTQIECNRVSDAPVRELYANDTAVLARREHSIAIYNAASLSLSAEFDWTGGRSTLYLAEEGFWAVGNLLEHRSFEGTSRRRIKLLLANRLRFFDAVARGGSVTVSGYLAYPDIPDNYEPLGFLECIPIDQLSEPSGKAGLCSINASSTLAWYDPCSIPPVFTGETIIQQVPGATAILSADLGVTRRIDTAYGRVFLAAGLDGMVYSLGVRRAAKTLTAMTKEGTIKYEVSLGADLGQFIMPPMVTPGNRVVCCGEKGFVLFDAVGQVAQTAPYPVQGLPAYPILQGEHMVVGVGTTISTYDPEGNLASIHTVADLGRITTPLLPSGPDALLVGSQTGLYHLTCG